MCATNERERAPSDRGGARYEADSRRNRTVRRGGRLFWPSCFSTTGTEDLRPAAHERYAMGAGDALRNERRWVTYDETRSISLMKGRNHGLVREILE